MMGKEQYEKPTVEKLDLGEQLRQARTLMSAVKTRVATIRLHRDALEGRVLNLEAEMGSLSVDVEFLDRVASRIDLILELRETQTVGDKWVGNDDRREP